MRKMLLPLFFIMTLSFASLAMASGVTLKVFTPFADMDPGAQMYIDLVDRWEAETGNAVEDFSGLQDEAWMEALKENIQTGNADVVVLPVGTSFSIEELASADEVISLLPDSNARKMIGMSEKNGDILLVPLRLNWETLYVNEDVFTSCGLPVPATFEDLIIDCLNLSQAGVTPIANALCEWPEIVLDCAALIGAPADQFGSKNSLDGAANVLTSLSLVGGFGKDPWNASDMEMEQAFLSGNAAMRFDTVDLAARIPTDRQDRVKVIMLPGMDGQSRAQLPGTPGYGISITRSCLESDRRDTALEFVAEMLAAPFGSQGAGLIAQSTYQINQTASDILGTLYDRDPENFSAWAEQVVASLMAN